jgi:hypothetical protein
MEVGATTSCWAAQSACSSSTEERRRRIFHLAFRFLHSEMVSDIEALQWLQDLRHFKVLTNGLWNCGNSLVQRLESEPKDDFWYYVRDTQLLVGPAASRNVLKG